MGKRVIWIVLVSLAGSAWGQSNDDSRGLKVHEAETFPGLNLYSPLETGSTYLIDNEGRVINTWESDYRPNTAYLLPNGNLLRMASFGRGGNGLFIAGGAGYKLEEYDWDGEKVWEFLYSSEDYLMHHNVEALPNGNVLILAYELKTREEAIQAGRDPELLRGGELWSEHILEVKPTRPVGGEVVWEWHLWDHLVQDIDETKDNYGNVAAHPELVDIGPTGSWISRLSEKEMNQLEFLSDKDRKKYSKLNMRGSGADWLHINAINYNPAHDLIAMSVWGNNELWVIDHSTTTAEVKGHSGGSYGKGGDLLYRWGNPLTYRAGGMADQRLFGQHDVHWIPEGLPGAGNFMVFNNGLGRPDGAYSSVDEFAPPFSATKGFHRDAGETWGPTELAWRYTAPVRTDLNSPFISGAQRQPNGNTLICVGGQGTFFEVTPEKETVWRYENPVTVEGERPSDNPSFLKYTAFRVYRYGLDFPAFEGKDLTPGPLLTEYEKEHPARWGKMLDEEPGGRVRSQDKGIDQF